MGEEVVPPSLEVLRRMATAAGADRGCGRGVKWRRRRTRPGEAAMVGSGIPAIGLPLAFY